MTDLDELIISTTQKLRDTAAQSERLCAGLQKAAPTDSAGKPSHAIQYLQSAADMLKQSAKDCLALGPAHLRESENKSQET